ncbi:MAG: electron transport complex subunit RsxC [Alphaproteobacteria bacterium]|nr:electron transport complex subunit RsxC [Alphaproteobacteria bacterium]
MIKKFTFPMGGIHPDKHKITTDCPIVDAGLPEIVNIPVKQHIGAPAKILVQKGDKVKVGTLLADADGIVSADVHSSVSGEVLKVENISGFSGYDEKMITIKVEGDEWEKSIDRTPDVVKEIKFTAEEIVKKIRQAGIVGMGGAGYPTPIKTTLPEGKKAEVLIVNGIECEPFLTADDRLMVEKAEQIIMGARVINRALGIQNAIIAIDENKPAAIEKLTALSKLYVGVNVRVCETKYPQGGEKQLVRAITGKEIPTGKLPIDVGCVVQNVGTVFAVYEAVLKNKPLFERIITVSGDACKHPCNYLVRVGTPISHLINLSGGMSDEVCKIVLGGPMMGNVAINTEAPATKLTSGVLLFKNGEFTKQVASTCIRCGRCALACPAGLRPFAIKQAVEFNDGVVELNRLHVLDCIECGCCAYTCPANIPLLDYCKIAKQDIRKK